MKRVCAVLYLGLIFLAACNGRSSPLATSGSTLTSTSTPSSTATSSPSPTPEPTPIGGGGQIILNVPSTVYRESHPELGDGYHLFSLDFVNKSLTPLSHPSGNKYIELGFPSPDGKFRAIVVSEDSDSQQLSLYLLNASSLEFIKIPFTFTDSYWVDHLWLAEDSLVFVGKLDLTGNSRVYFYRIGMLEPIAISPSNLDVYRLLGAVAPDGPVYWEGTSVYYQLSDLTGKSSKTEIDGDTIEYLELTSDTQWFIVRQSHGLALRSFDGSVTISANKALDEMRTNPSSFAQRFNWSPDKKFVIFLLPGSGDIRDCEDDDIFIWNIENNVLVKLGDGAPSFACYADFAWNQQNNQVIFGTRGPQGNSFEFAIYYVYSLEDFSLIKEVPNTWRGVTLVISPDGGSALSINDQREPVIVNLEDFSYTNLGLPGSWLEDAYKVSGFWVGE